MRLFAIAAFLCVGALSRAQQTSSPASQSDVDPHLAKVIADIPAFDDHAHPVLSPPADTSDREFDALPVDNMAPQTDPVALRADYPALHDAWKALFKVDLYPPLNTADTAKLDAARRTVRQSKGTGYADWVLQQAGIRTMVANRVRMGTGVQPPRFLWVPYDDALLFPLSTATLAKENPDRAQFFALEDKLRAHYLADAGLMEYPADLDDYVQKVVMPTLQRQKNGGAIAIKFELAYLRGLDIGNPSKADAATIYSSAHSSDMPLDAAAYKPLQDYLFRVIAAECGRLGMAVHFHGMAGAGSFFSIAGADPLNIEPVFNDPALRGTNFVMLHGGWPFVHEAGAVLQKPNVYLDISQQSLVIPAHTLALWLREWLELYPDKVLFATDAYPYSPALGWEESAWLATRNARRALGIALTGMVRDREITETRAEEIAAMVLHSNAESLYRASISH